MSNSNMFFFVLRLYVLKYNFTNFKTLKELNRNLHPSQLLSKVTFILDMSYNLNNDFILYSISESF